MASEYQVSLGDAVIDEEGDSEIKVTLGDAVIVPDASLLTSIFPIRSGKISYASKFDTIHEGVDIFAPMGSEVIALQDGQVRSSVETRGGNVVYLVTSDGTQYFYSHLQDFAGEFPRKVKAGDLIGYVGDTGNAKGAPPHVHFELRPYGGAKVDPVPFLNALRDMMNAEEQRARFGLVVKTASASEHALMGSMLVAVTLVALSFFKSRKGKR